MQAGHVLVQPMRVPDLLDDLVQMQLGGIGDGGVRAGLREQGFRY